MSERSLIAKAQDFVRQGGTITMTLPTGVVLPAEPVCIMSLTDEWLWWLYVFGDHPHAVQVDSITPGPDGEVLVEDDDHRVAAIWGTWHESQIEELERWLEGTRTQMVYLGVSPEPPDIVRYEGQRR